MDDTLCVERVEGGQDLEHDRDGVGKLDRTASHTMGQGFALKQFHRDEQRLPIFTDLIELADVGMTDAGGGPGFAPKARSGRLVV